MIGLLVLGLVRVVGTAQADEGSPIAKRIARAYGLDAYERVEAIRYTFNLETTGLNLSRSWMWEPKTGRISYESKDKDGNPVKVSFVQSELTADSPAVKDRIDWFFVNDNYWLILPFHVYWDSSGAEVQDRGTHKLPLGKGSAKLVTVQYPKGGYTPGDTWDLYLGSDSRLKEMIYHRGDPKSPVPGIVTVSWAGYRKAGPLVFSTEHRGIADGKPMHLFFSNVSVKLEGSDKWVDAMK
jgi:hypothetical protein